MLILLTVSKNNNNSSNTPNQKSKNILLKMVDQDLVLQVSLMIYLYYYII